MYLVLCEHLCAVVMETQSPLHRSFLVTPSDGSITNIWLVQNGTKCGIDQVRIIKWCLLQQLHPCPLPILRLPPPPYYAYPSPILRLPLPHITPAPSPILRPPPPPYYARPPPHIMPAPSPILRPPPSPI